MDQKYSGMTVNERLYASGLLDNFEQAISEKNTDEAVRILRKVELTDANIEPILKKWEMPTTGDL